MKKRLFGYAEIIEIFIWIFSAFLLKKLCVKVLSKFVLQNLNSGLSSHTECFIDHISCLADSHFLADRIPRFHTYTFGVKHNAVHIKNYCFKLHYLKHLLKKSVLLPMLSITILLLLTFMYLSPWCSFTSVLSIPLAIGAACGITGNVRNFTKSKSLLKDISS